MWPSFIWIGLSKRGLRAVRYEALPRYPAVERDFSFVFDDSIEFATIEKTVAELGLGELRSFVPVEIFRGGAIPARKYSLLLRATFQSVERTLREDEVGRWSGEIIRTLEGLGGGAEDGLGVLENCSVLTRKR